MPKRKLQAHTAEVHCRNLPCVSLTRFRAYMCTYMYPDAELAKERKCGAFACDLKIKSKNFPAPTRERNVYICAAW